MKDLAKGTAWVSRRVYLRGNNWLGRESGGRVNQHDCEHPVE